MHEDLNRVKQKKIVEQIEDETKTDEELAQLSWQNHLKRNQSIMVDLFQGQFKSTITCPECNRVSVTFDPFNTLSLPIPITTEKIIEIYVVFANYRRKGIKLKIKYKKLEHKIDDLKQDIKKMLDGDLSENIEFVKHFSHTSRDFITLDSMVYTNELRKKSKRHVLFCLEIPEEDIRIPDENKRAVGVYFYLEANPKSEGTSFWSRKPQTYLREIIISLQGTTKDLYLRVFKYIKFLYQDILNAEDWQILSQMNDQDAFVEFYDKREMRIFKLKLISNAKYYGECIYCGMRECKNCVVDYDNPKSLSELYEKAKQEKHDFEIEVVMLNEKFPNLKPAELNTYIDFETKNIVEKKDETTYSYRSSEKPKITRNIDECFRQFSVPEQLCQDNMWYCNKCKKHQEALKKMEIYKAPPILIIHLKRFRSEGRSAYGFISSRSKISDIISFPTNGRGILDLSPYVLSKGFPSEYPLERIVPNHELPFLDPLENIPKTELKLEKPRDNDDWASGWKENSLFKTPTEDLILTVHDDILDNMLNNNPDNLTIEEPKEELKKEKSKTEETKTEPKSDKHMQNGEKIIEENRNGVEINDPNSMEYELMSIVNHYGSMGGGHYTAYVKNHLYQVWREFDDSKIKPISEDAICSEAAYVLFYRKKNLNFKL